MHVCMYVCYVCMYVRMCVVDVQEAKEVEVKAAQEDRVDEVIEVFMCVCMLCMCVCEDVCECKRRR
jgi:hypothetical protein